MHFCVLFKVRTNFAGYCLNKILLYLSLFTLSQINLDCSFKPINELFNKINYKCLSSHYALATPVADFVKRSVNNVKKNNYYHFYLCLNHFNIYCQECFEH